MSSLIDAQPSAVAECPSEEGRRARKKRETRQALSRAAVALAREHGLDGITVEQIADAADVSPRTFFNYFASKEEAIVNPDPETVSQFVALLAERPAAESPFVALREACVAFSTQRLASPEQFRIRLELVSAEPALLMASLAHWHSVQQALTELLAERAGFSAQDAYPLVAVTTVLEAARLAIHRWGNGWDARPLPEQVRECIDLIGAGLSAPRRPRSHTAPPRPTAPPTPTAGRFPVPMSAVRR